MPTTLFTGKANISLDQYPESAWTPIGAHGKAANTETAVLYEAVAWLYRCMQIRANSVQAVPWAVVRGEDDAWTSDDPMPPPALTFLANLPDLLFLAEGALSLTSEAFWFIERNRVKPIALRWHAPSSVVAIWDEDRGLVGYERQLGQGKTATFEPTDYVYMRLPNFLHETKPGISPAQAAMRAAGVLYQKDEYEQGYFERGAIKATLLQVPPGTPKTERDSLERWWNRLATGVRKAFTTIVISSELTPVVVGEGIGDLGNSPLTQEKKEDIATALGIPHSLVFSNAANFATATQDWLNYYDQTIIPEVNTIAGYVNEQLLEPLGYFLEFRHEQMSVYQEDEGQRADSLAQLVASGTPLDLAMEILGYDLTDEQWLRVREPDPVEVVEPSPEPPIVLDQMADEMRAVELGRFKRWAAKRKNPDPDAFTSDILSYADKAAILAEGGDADTMPPFTLPAGPITPEWWASTKAMILQLDPDDPEAEQKARMEIERIAADEIEKKLAAQGRAITASAPTSASEAIERAREAGEPLRDTLRRMLQRSADLGVSVAVDQFATIGFGFDWTLANQAAADWVQRYTFDLVGGINRTTEQRLQTAISEWITNGDSLPTLRRELERNLFSRHRAELIASTEVTRAYAEANQIAYRESGVASRMEWRTANDERVCPICGPLGEKSVTSAFGGQFEHPETGTGYGIPPAHPRCRCWIVPVIQEPQ